MVCDARDAQAHRSLVTAQELAFVGSVVETSLEQNNAAGSQRALLGDGVRDSAEQSDMADVSEEDQPDGEAEVWSWTTFEVDAWYTSDAGQQISIWTEGLDLAVGERWLVAGAAFATPEGLGDHMDQSGLAAVCASEIYSTSAASDWDEWFGGSVTPGAMEPEGEPDAAAVEEIEAGRDKWGQLGPDSYTARMRVFTEDDETEEETGCVSSGAFLRVVVVEGTLDEALNIERGCRVEDVSGVYLIDDLFDLAITASGAGDDSGYELDPFYGYPRYLYGYDRSFGIDVYVESLVPIASPGLIGDEISRDIGSFRDRWDAAGISDYGYVVDWLCFCEFSGPSMVTVADGVTESIVFQGDSVFEDASVDPRFLDDLPGTVYELFELIETEIDNADLVVAGFDSQLGYPTDVYIDSITNAVDDELTIVVSNFESR